MLKIEVNEKEKNCQCEIVGKKAELMAEYCALTESMIDQGVVSLEEVKLLIKTVEEVLKIKNDPEEENQIKNFLKSLLN